SLAVELDPPLCEKIEHLAISHHPTPIEDPVAHQRRAAIPRKQQPATALLLRGHPFCPLDLKKPMLRVVLAERRQARLPEQRASSLRPPSERAPDPNRERRLVGQH